jgi:hypothetical protein
LYSPAFPIIAEKKKNLSDPIPAAGATGARPHTLNQTNKDGDKLGELHDQPFPRERKKYERKKK